MSGENPSQSSASSVTKNIASNVQSNRVKISDEHLDLIKLIGGCSGGVVALSSFTANDKGGIISEIIFSRVSNTVATSILDQALRAKTYLQGKYGDAYPTTVEENAFNAFIEIMKSLTKTKPDDPNRTKLLHANVSIEVLVTMLKECDEKLLKY